MQSWRNLLGVDLLRASLKGGILAALRGAKENAVWANQ